MHIDSVVHMMLQATATHLHEGKFSLSFVIGYLHIDNLKKKKKTSHIISSSAAERLRSLNSPCCRTVFGFNFLKAEPLHFTLFESAVEKQIACHSNGARENPFFSATTLLGTTATTGVAFKCIQLLLINARNLDGTKTTV